MLPRFKELHIRITLLSQVQIHHCWGNISEVITPIYDPQIKDDLKRVIDFALNDSLQGRTVDGTGRNLPWTNDEGTPFRSQEALYKHYQSNL